MPQVAGRPIYIPGAWTEHGITCWTQLAEPTFPRESRGEGPPELWSLEDEPTRVAHRLVLHDIYAGRENGAGVGARLLVHEIGRRLRRNVVRWPIDWPEDQRFSLPCPRPHGFWTAYILQQPEWMRQ